MEGPVFRNLSEAECNEIVPRLQVSFREPFFVPRVRGLIKSLFGRSLLDLLPRTRSDWSNIFEPWVKLSESLGTGRTMDRHSKLPTLDSRELIFVESLGRLEAHLIV